MVEGAPGGDDHRRAPASLSVGEIGALVGGRVVGDATLRIGRVAPVDEAVEGTAAFLALPRYAKYAPESRASAFLVTEELVSELPDGATAVVVADGYGALQELLSALHPEVVPEPGIHPTAVIGRGTTLGQNVSLGPYVVVGEDVTIADHAVIEAHSVVGDGSQIGPGTRLHPHVVIYPDSSIGAGVILHSGVRVGADGFGYTVVDGEHKKMPQVGRAVLEDGVEIGANTTVDRGSLGDTVVSRGSKVDNLVQIAHNVRVGAGTLIAALVGIAGSTRIGKRVWIGGQAGVINQLEVGDDAKITVASVVTRDVKEGETLSGHPARPHREELRRQAGLSRLDTLKKRVERLEDEATKESG